MLVFSTILMCSCSTWKQEQFTYTVITSYSLRSGRLDQFLIKKAVGSTLQFSEGIGDVNSGCKMDPGVCKMVSCT